MANLIMRFKQDKSGKTSNKQPIELIKQVVMELESGVRPEVIREKYGNIKNSTLKGWIRRHGSGKEVNWGHRQFSYQLKHQVVYELESGLLTLGEAVRKYQVSENALRLWLKNHNIGSLPAEGSPEAPQSNMEDKQRKELLQQMNELKLKITALETMIDLAEEHYHFPIRKKFGTKQ